MSIVGAALQRNLLRTALTAGRNLGVDQRVIEELPDGAWDAVVIEGTGVLVAGGDKWVAGSNPA